MTNRKQLEVGNEMNGVVTYVPDILTTLGMPLPLKSVASPRKVFIGKRECRVSIVNFASVVVVHPGLFSGQ